MGSNRGFVSFSREDGFEPIPEAQLRGDGAASDRSVTPPPTPGRLTTPQPGTPAFDLKSRRNEYIVHTSVHAALAERVELLEEYVEALETRLAALEAARPSARHGRRNAKGARL